MRCRLRPIELERVVLAVERRLNARNFKTACPETGEDIKVMGVRDRDDISLTVSCAFVGWFLKNIKAYGETKDRLREIVLETARAITVRNIAIRVNAADDMATGSVFLTVSGTSAEAGDDGQTGRGNRANGLITPCRPMTLEASAGKNPVTHVGKLYNAAASRLAAAVIAEVPFLYHALGHDHQAHVLALGGFAFDERAEPLGKQFIIICKRICSNQVSASPSRNGNDPRGLNPTPVRVSS